MSEPQFREAARATADLVADYLAAVPERPVWQPMEPAARARLLDAPLPAGGRDLAQLLKVIEEQVLPAPMGNGHRGSSGG